MTNETFRTKPNPDQPGRCPSIDPDDTLQCTRAFHDDDSCHSGGIAWRKGSPRYISDRERAEDAEVAVAELRAEVERLRGQLGIGAHGTTVRADPDEALIEAIAEAICGHASDWSIETEGFKDDYRREARRAYATMAEHLGRLSARAEAAEAKVKAIESVRALHFPHEADVFVSGTRWCDVEGDDWPCPTIRLLDGLSEVDPHPSIVDGLNFRAAMGDTP